MTTVRQSVLWSTQYWRVSGAITFSKEIMDVVVGTSVLAARDVEVMEGVVVLVPMVGIMG